MDAASRRAVHRLLERARADRDVLAVIPFGSHARGEPSPASDVDVCLVLAGDPDRAAQTAKRLAYLGETDADVAVFQSLPLHIRSRILGEGRILFVRDEDALYALAVRTVRAWEDFRHIHRRYLDEVARG
jgi:predicted nucleotidyltransferase